MRDSRPPFRLLAVLVLAAVNPIACDCDPEPIQSFTCAFEVTPSGEGSVIQFNATDVGDSAERTWTVTNTGNGVTLDQLEVTFESVNGEHFDADIPDGTRITANDDQTFTVVFHPLAEADIASRFVVSHPDVGNAKCPSATVFVRGTGIRPLDVDAGQPDAGDEDGGIPDEDAGVDAGTIETPDGGVILPPGGEWFAYGGLENARTRFAAVELKDGTGNVLVVGGYGEDGEALDSIERLNPTTGVSRVVGHMAVPRAEPAAATLSDGRVVIVGGRSAALAGFALRTVEIFDPINGDTLSCADLGGCGLDAQDQGVLPQGRIGAIASASLTDEVFVVLGRTLDGGGNEVPLAGGDVITFAPTARTGLTNANLLGARVGAVPVVDPASGSFLLIGGRSGTGVVLGDVLHVDAASNTVGSVDTLAFPRAFAAAALLSDGSAMIAGGFSGTGGGVVDVELVTQAFNNAAVAPADLQLTPRVGGALLALGGDIVLWAGGTPGRVDNLDVEDSVLPGTGADLVVPFGASSFLRVSPDNDLAQGRVEQQALVVGSQKDAAVFIGGINTTPRRTPHPHVERYILDENRFFTFGLMGAGTGLEAGVVNGSGAALVSAGGVDPHTGRTSSAVRAFDAEHGVFVEAGALREPRRDHTLTRISVSDDQAMLVAGGRDEAGTVLSSLSILDPVNKIDRPLPVTLRTPRAGHSATRLQDGNPIADGAVLLCGGQGQGGEPLDNCEVVVPPGNALNPATYDEAEVLSVAGRLSAGRVGHTATLLDSGEVLLVGGGDPAVDLVTADLFLVGQTGADPFVRPTGQPVRARRGHAAVLLGSGRVLVVGGEVFDSALGATRAAELYVRLTETFVAVADMEQERAAPAAFLLGNGDVLVAGGTRNNPGVAGVPSRSNITSELYVAGATGVGTFEELPETDLSYGRSDVLFVDVFGRAIVVGGTHRDGTVGTGDERRTPITFVDFLQDPADAIQP